MLGVPMLKEAHTAVNMARELRSVLDDFKILDDKVHIVLRDGASAMVLLTKILDFESFHCFLHILHLVGFLVLM